MGQILTQLQKKPCSCFRIISYQKAKTFKEAGEIHLPKGWHRTLPPLYTVAVLPPTQLSLCKWENTSRTQMSSPAPCPLWLSWELRNAEKQLQGLASIWSTLTLISGWDTFNLCSWQWTAGWQRLPAAWRDTCWRAAEWVRCRSGECEFLREFPSLLMHSSLSATVTKFGWCLAYWINTIKMTESPLFF